MQVSDRNKNKQYVTTLAIVCGVLQLALAPSIQLGAGVASFALVFAACIALMQGGRTGIICGFCAGLFFDLTTTGPIGLMAFELTVTAFVLGMEGRNRLAEDTSAAVRDYAIAAFAVSVFYGIAMLIVGQSSSFVDAVFVRAIPTAILDVIAFLPFAYYLSRGTGTPSLMGGRHSSGGRRGGHFSSRGL